MQKLRILYTSSGEILQTYGLEGKGDFPISEESHLEKFPLGTKSLTLDDSTQIEKFLTAANNKMVDGTLQIGQPIPPMKITLPRDLRTEFDALKSQLIQKGVIS